MARERIGFIGLGRMGSGMAANLVNADIDLHVYDVDAGAMQRLVDKGATPCEDAADVAARVDLLFLCLPYTTEVDAALDGERGVLAAARDGLAIVDTTTQNYFATVALGERCEKAGVGYSDCPISGMPHRAADGTLTMMFGGSDAAFARAKPLLERMGRYIVHCGAVGSGQMMKAINNIIYNVNIAAICEVMPLAVKAGLDVEQVAEVVTSGSARSFASEYFVPRILDGRFDGDFSMGAAYKDIVNVQEIAARLGAATPVVNAMVATYQHAIAMGCGDEPKSAMIKVYERVLGLEVRHGVKAGGD
ncbi:MAG: NAD(P)-dependent oxidoreductase [Gammaproteobacteria bacterium]|nr:NAD(P)-dependent oxidoreductase [Gammaproteobacteria bacterium]